MSAPILLRSGAALCAAICLACAAPGVQAATASPDAAQGNDAAADDAAPPTPKIPGIESDAILRAVYTCADGAQLEVVFVNTTSGNSFAVIEHDGHLVPMSLAISASGARWLAVDPDTKLELWEHQGAISLYQGEGGPAILQDCPGGAS